MSGRGCCGIYGDQDNGGCEKRGGGHGKGHGPHKCTYFHGENHMVDICWDLHWKPIAHQISFQKEENVHNPFQPRESIVHKGHFGLVKGTICFGTCH